MCCSVSLPVGHWNGMNNQRKIQHSSGCTFSDLTHNLALLEFDASVKGGGARKYVGLLEEL